MKLECTSDDLIRRVCELDISGVSLDKSFVVEGRSERWEGDLLCFVRERCM